MDRLEAMSAFVAVVEQNGFAPAARRLAISPSAVTRLVAALEEQLGITLLRRTTRSMTLTDAGARYLERARRILSEVEEAERSAQAERNVPSGRLLVTAPATFGRIHLAFAHFRVECRSVTSHFGRVPCAQTFDLRLCFSSRLRKLRT